MIINMTKTVEVEATTLELCVKVRDCFAASLRDQDGEEISEYEGYVPDFMPGDHYGDYLMLNIDLDTGRITNWRKPTQSDIEEFVGQCQSDS